MVRSDGWTEAVWGVGIGSSEKESAARAIISALVVSTTLVLSLYAQLLTTSELQVHGELGTTSPSDINSLSSRMDNDTLRMDAAPAPQIFDVPS
jgi:hypothetical protein